MRPAGEAVLRQAGVSLSTVKTVNAKAVGKVVAPGAAAAARLAGSGSAVNNNATMAPERVVRQRAIPGWSPGDKPKNVSSLEQQRAMVAMLRAQAKEEAGRGNKAKTAATATTGAGGRGAGGAAPGGQAVGAGAKAGTGQPVRRQLIVHEDADNDSGSDDSEDHSYYRHLRDEVNSESSEELATPAQPREFQLAQEDFPAFPSAAASQQQHASVASSMAATPTKQQQQPRAVMPSTPAAARESQAPSSAASPASLAAAAVPPSPDAAAAEAAAAAEEDPDPVVAYDPVYAAEDGTTVLVQDAYGNFVRVEDVYGPEPEYLGVQEDDGTVTYYVVIRQSALLAAQAAAQLEQQQSLTPADSLDGASAAVVLPSSVADTAVPAPLPVAAAPTQPLLAPSPSGGFPLQLPVTPPQQQQQTLAAVMGLQPTPAAAPAPAAAAAEEEGDLDDLMALCMGGGGSAAAPAPAAGSAGLAGTAGYADPYAHAAVYAAAAAAAPPPQEYYVHGGGYPAQGYAVAAAPAGAHVSQRYGAAQQEGAELDDLMQLLCV